MVNLFLSLFFLLILIVFVWFDFCFVSRVFFGGKGEVGGVIQAAIRSSLRSDT